MGGRTGNLGIAGPTVEYTQMLNPEGIPENPDFRYLGQTTEYMEYGKFNVLATHISGLVNGRPLTYAIKTGVTEQRIGNGYMEVMKTRYDGRFVTCIRVDSKKKGKQSRINWENGLRAHSRTIDRLMKGKKVEKADVISDLWSLDSE